MLYSFIITQASSGLKKKARFCKYKYLDVKIAGLVIVKSCVTVGHFVGGKYFVSLNHTASDRKLGKGLGTRLV